MLAMAAAHPLTAHAPAPSLPNMLHLPAALPSSPASALQVSGDLAHTWSADGPYGFSEHAAKFDAAVQDWARQLDRDALIKVWKGGAGLRAWGLRGARGRGDWVSGLAGGRLVSQSQPNKSTGRAHRAREGGLRGRCAAERVEVRKRMIDRPYALARQQGRSCSFPPPSCRPPPSRLLMLPAPPPTHTHTHTRALVLQVAAKHVGEAKSCGFPGLVALQGVIDSVKPDNLHRCGRVMRSGVMREGVGCGGAQASCVEVQGTAGREGGDGLNSERLEPEAEPDRQVHHPANACLTVVACVALCPPVPTQRAAGVWAPLVLWHDVRPVRLPR